MKNQAVMPQLAGVSFTEPLKISADLAAFSIPLWVLLGDSAIYIIKNNCFSRPNGALHHNVYGSNVIGEL